MLRGRKTQGGFTLLELLITVAIVGIVLGLALPNLSSFTGNAELKGSSDRLTNQLRKSRSEAIKRIAQVGFCPSSTSQSATPSCGGNFSQGWIAYIDDDQNGAMDAGEELLLLGEAVPATVSLTIDQSLSSGFVFSISGVGTNSTGVPIRGVITFSHEASGTRDVNISAGGRISVTGDTN